MSHRYEPVRRGSRWGVAAMGGVALIGVVTIGAGIDTHQTPPPTPSAAQGVDSGPIAGTDSVPAPSSTTTSTDATSTGSAKEASAKPFLMDKSSPVRLTIPRINVDTPLDHRGLQKDGTLAVPPPSAKSNASFYTGSPTPGEQGPAVIIGHVDALKDGPAVFYDLGKLKQGDQINVFRKDKSVATFTVRRNVLIKKTEFPTKKIYGNTPDSELRLMTCGGVFNEATGRHLSNVVVFASLEKIDGKNVKQWRADQKK